MCRGRRGGIATGAALAVVVYFGAVWHRAYGDGIGDATSRVFSCVSEARAVIDERSVSEIRAERDRQLAACSDPGEPAVVAAHRWCVIAELSLTLGDDRAAQYYARAIATAPDPGYELRLGDYFRTMRGARGALSSQAVRHYLAALDGVRARADSPGGSDDAIAAWATRGLRLTYQQDGLAVTPPPASSGRATSPWPTLAVIVAGRVGFDTNDTRLDDASAAQVDDARRFTAEAMFASSAFRAARSLTGNELQAIARAPLRAELMARGRLRASLFGALDVWYRQAQVDGGEIASYQQPTVMNDITTSELGAGFAHALDLSPVFDLLLAGDYRRIHRVGVVESAPEQPQDFNVFELRPAIARYLGPDRVSLAGQYSAMIIPDAMGGAVADRARGRMIAAVDIDYTMNRLLLRPFASPALRAFAGIAQDAETFGTRLVRRRDLHLGLGVSRVHGWDATVQASAFTAAVEVQSRDPAQTLEDPQQRNAQYRTTVVLLRRVIDEDAVGLWQEDGAVVVSVNAVATVRHDLALRGLAAYDNVRGGVELWTKLLVSGLRDTAVLLSAGYDHQYFYAIGKDLHIVHVDVRMGW